MVATDGLHTSTSKSDFVCSKIMWFPIPKFILDLEKKNYTHFWLSSKCLYEQLKRQCPDASCRSFCLMHFYFYLYLFAVIITIYWNSDAAYFVPFVLPCSRKRWSFTLGCFSFPWQRGLSMMNLQSVASWPLWPSNPYFKRWANISSVSFFICYA